jgi:hypothetical protein
VCSDTSGTRMAVWGSGKSPAPEHPPPPPPAYQPLRSHPHPLPAVPAVDAHTRVSQKAVARAVTQAMPAMANSGHARQSFRTRWCLRILDTRLPANSPAIRSTGMTGRLRDSPGATGRRSKLPLRSSPPLPPAPTLPHQLTLVQQQLAQAQYQLAQAQQQPGGPPSPAAKAG